MGPEGQGEEAGFYSEMGNLYELFLNNFTRKQKNMFRWWLCFTNGCLLRPEQLLRTL